MAELTVIWWRDIPPHVRRRRADTGGARAAAALSGGDRRRRDARRADRSDPYLEEWRREPRGCGDDLEAEVAQEVEWLDAAFTDDVLERLVGASGKETG